MTQITRKSVPMRGLILLLTVTLGAGLVLMGCGDDAPATTPAPAPPPPAPAPAPEPEPMAPATPTGLHVDETTQNSITWHWTASEGALGYVVQASMDEMFDDTDTVLFDGAPWTTATEYTATDLEPETTVHVRVAAAAGTADAPLVSEFSASVSGMSAMPPPEPTPFSVEFMVPDGEFPMKPDDETDEATAMASVNNDMGVTVNMPAIVSATFMEGSSPIGLIPGENMPFKYVDWSALQSTVVSATGAQFSVIPVEIGANQVPIPIGSGVIVSCGPFACATGPMAPEISIGDSTVCAGWDPQVELEVGWVNNQIDTDAAAAGNQDAQDGVDIGWRTTSTAPMSVTHHFAGVANGQNLEIKGPGAGKGTSKALKMTNDDVSANDYSPALIQGAGADGDLAATADNTLVCAGDGTGEPYAGSTASALDMPENCFRVNTRGSTKTDYFGGYSIELAASGSAVAWGSVEWETDPFEDLTCDTMTFAAAELVNVCDLFAEEVAQALEAGWAGSKGESVNFVLDTTNADVVASLQIPAPTSASSYRFDTNWFNPSGKGDPGTDIYADTDAATDGTQRAPATLALLDADGDPKYGDFGKVDFEKRNADDATASDPADAGSWVWGSDGTAENANSSTDNKCSDDDGGDGCDAEFTEMMELTFASGSALGCKETVMVEVTCSWDANGEMGRHRADDHQVSGADGSPGSFFADFAVEDTATAPSRTPGFIGAFAKCTVN